MASTPQTRVHKLKEQLAQHVSARDWQTYFRSTIIPHRETAARVRSTTRPIKDRVDAIHLAVCHPWSQQSFAAWLAKNDRCTDLMTYLEHNHTSCKQSQVTAERLQLGLTDKISAWCLNQPWVAWAVRRSACSTSLVREPQLRSEMMHTGTYYSI